MFIIRYHVIAVTGNQPECQPHTLATDFFRTKAAGFTLPAGNHLLDKVGLAGEQVYPFHRQV